MRGFLRCIGYLAVVGVANFLLGRVLPKKWFRWDRFPYRPVPGEGKLYERLGIRRWKDYLPDMSRILPRVMPSKRLPSVLTGPALERMLQETCVAEFIHVLLILPALYCAWLWPGAGGWTVFLLYAVLNLPFVMVQRYNRPKLARIASKLQDSKGPKT